MRPLHNRPHPGQEDVILGIDSERTEHSRLVGINIASEGNEAPGRVMGALAELAASHGFDFAGSRSPLVRRAEGTLLVSFTARFFSGEASNWRDMEPKATRFGLDVAVPRCLKVPRVRGDSAATGRSPVDAAREDEPDLLLLIEADDASKCDSFTRNLAARPNVELRFTVAGRNFPAGMNALGYAEGLSNLQDVRRADQKRYHSYVFAGPGEDYLHQGGTYLVCRQYHYDLQRWFSQSSQKRDVIIGRSRQGLFVDAAGREISDDVPEEKLGGRIASCSHVSHVNPRRFARTQFGDVVRPPDIRILRRASEIWEDGSPTGLLFTCFQADIQRRGFEYINNNWIMASGFNSGCDQLLDPSQGFVRPVSTCYSFVPPFRTIPGDAFLNLPRRSI
jgi:Dyp-type peroxidase family